MLLLVASFASAHRQMLLCVETGTSYFLLKCKVLVAQFASAHSRMLFFDEIIMLTMLFFVEIVLKEICLNPIQQKMTMRANGAI